MTYIIHSLIPYLDDARHLSDLEQSDNIGKSKNCVTRENEAGRLVSIHAFSVTMLLGDHRKVPGRLSGQRHPGNCKEMAEK